MAVIIKWSFAKLIKVIVLTLMNDFDFFIVIEGNRGTGKSTLAIQIARAVKRVFKQAGLDHGYKHFTLRRGLIYTQKEFKRFLHKWNRTGIADEMINVTFNRDFFSEDQKDIIKMVNMNRDHHNLIIACVPMFKTLDSQVKNLCKMRLTVVRRGLAVIQTPNRTIYSKDKWDEALNEKIERKWVEKQIKKPQYAKLTTFRGVVRFRKLPEKVERLYKEIKEQRRNIIAKEEMGIEIDETDKELNTLEEAFVKLKAGKIKNMDILDGMAHAIGEKPLNFRSKIRTRLSNEGLSSSLADYFWEKKSKDQAKKLSKQVKAIPTEMIEEVEF